MYSKSSPCETLIVNWIWYVQCHTCDYVDWINKLSYAKLSITSNKNEMYLINLQKKLVSLEDTVT
jgi:hypothetical protein